MKVCKFDQPIMPNQVVISDMYGFDLIQNLISVDPACFSDDVSGNGFVKDYTGAAELLIAATQTGDVETTQLPGDYSNVRLCFKKSTQDGGLACTEEFLLKLCSILTPTIADIVVMTGSHIHSLGAIRESMSTDPGCFKNPLSGFVKQNGENLLIEGEFENC
jgi:hypothetical protein